MQRASEGLSEWVELTIVGSAGCSQHAPHGVEVIEAPATMGKFLLLGGIKAIKACRRTDYDLVIGGSGLVSPILLLLKKIFGLKTAVFIHGLDIVVNNVLYQHIFVPCINRADLIIANSRNTRCLAMERGAPKGAITVINPGTDTPDLVSVLPREAFCKKFDIPFQKIMLFTGRMTRRKGLSGFIANCLPHILESVPNSGLVVVGDNPGDSLNRQGEKAEILELVQDLDLARRVIFLGKVSDKDLLATYAAADVQIFPLIEVSGDVEGFGMVAIEAAACGTPTVAFDLGGVADAIGPDNGTLVTPGDYKAFSAATCDVLTGAEPDSPRCLAHGRRFSWQRFHRELADALQLETPAPTLAAGASTK